MFVFFFYSLPPVHLSLCWPSASLWMLISFYYQIFLNKFSAFFPSSDPLVSILFVFALTKSYPFPLQREKGHPILSCCSSRHFIRKALDPLYALRGIQHKLRLSQWYPPDLAEMQAVRGLWYGSVLLPSCYYDLAQELNDDILEDSRVLCVFWWVVYCLLGPLRVVRAIVGLYVRGIWVFHVLLCFKRTARGGHFSHCCWVAETLAKI